MHNYSRSICIRIENEGIEGGRLGRKDLDKAGRDRGFGRDGFGDG